MPIKRHWQVPSYGLEVEQTLDKPDDWGKSLFWYCAHCGKQYAFAWIADKKWQGISGCCQQCWTFAHPYSISGGVFDTVQLIGEEIPPEIYRYQLSREINFLNHSNHPYNEKE
jgi:hypothetical protein